jgi:4-hydroxy-2-oxoheptanedioate aldolase
MTPLRARIAAAARPDQAPLLGPFLAVPAAMVVEIACASGPDFVCIDMEHGPISAQTGEAMVRAAALSQVPALVRVPGVDAVAIGQALDWGAEGILVPRVNSAQDARQAVDAARYPPQGSRGAGPGRASGYGRAISAAIARARRDTVVAVQIETLPALDQLETILAVEGVDLFFIGPGDLQLGLEAAGRPEPIGVVIDQILQACRSKGRPCGLFAMTRDALSPYDDQVALGIIGSDATVLIAGFDAMYGA